ncbi:MAG: hypothetical protein EXQ79_03155 [Acidimicrobiia bacterium]|nr:hypothetical protein [Acidimicrobiia bacterium]
MQIKPRYDTPDFFRFEGAFTDPSVPLLRQRRRSSSIVSEFDDEQCAAPSRCDEWSVQDVIAHLAGVNRFWALGDEHRWLVSGLAEVFDLAP